MSVAFESPVGQPAPDLIERGIEVLPRLIEPPTTGRPQGCFGRHESRPIRFFTAMVGAEIDQPSKRRLMDRGFARLSSKLAHEAERLSPSTSTWSR